MKAKLYNYETKKTTEIDTQFLTLFQWVQVNFADWWFYEIKRFGKNSYTITDRFTKQTVYKIN